MNNKKAILAIVIVAPIVLATTVFLTMEPNIPPEAATQVEPPAQPGPKTTNVAPDINRGPRPTQSRFKKGVERINDLSTALEAAKESLQKVEKEISAAGENVPENLLRKKEIAEKVVKRLSERI